MKHKTPEAAQGSPDTATTTNPARVPFDQVLRRLVDAKANKPAPKPNKPPKKL